MSGSAIGVAFVALAGLVLVALGVRSGRHRQIATAVLSGITGLALALIAAAATLLAFGLSSFDRLAHETRAAELQFLQESQGKYVATLRLPSGSARYFELTGDEWQIDARVIKWRAAAALLGFDTVYRLERLQGRYRDLEQERTALRSVYALSEPGWLDLWDLVRRNADWLPGVDAMYGSATYLPLADGATYELMVSQTGLLARPVNDAARRAVAGWR
jgi:hypothetical protein